MVHGSKIATCADRCNVVCCADCYYDMAIDGGESACVVWVLFTIAWRLVGIGKPLGNGSSSNTDGWDGTSAVVITTTTSIID